MSREENIKKTTDELLSELSKSPLSGFLNDNAGELSDGELSKYLSELLKEKNMSRAEVIRRSGIFDVYGYEIFSGKKHPSRDNVIRLIFGFPLELSEAQKLLKYSFYAPLYPRNKRDAVIISYLGKSITDLNLELDSLGLSPIL